MIRELDAQFQREQLHRAAADGDLAEVNRLIELNYPVNRFDYIGKTPLHYAVSGGHLDVIDRLIAADANVNANDERWIGNTPLSDCIENCSYEIVVRLLDAGADPTIRGWMQLNAIDRAKCRKDADARKILRMLKSR